MNTATETSIATETPSNPGWTTPSNPGWTAATLSTSELVALVNHLYLTAQPGSPGAELFTRASDELYKRRLSAIRQLDDSTLRSIQRDFNNAQCAIASLNVRFYFLDKVLDSPSTDEDDVWDKSAIANLFPQDIEAIDTAANTDTFMGIHPFSVSRPVEMETLATMIEDEVARRNKEAARARRAKKRSK